MTDKDDRIGSERETGKIEVGFKITDDLHGVHDRQYYGDYSDDGLCGKVQVILIK